MQNDSPVLNVGLLWLMDPKMGIVENAREALQHHQEKFGYEATLINANPTEVPESGIEVDGLRVMPVEGTLGKHLFVGVHVERRNK